MSYPPVSCGNASFLELNLLSIAIFTSFILYAITVRASSKIYDKGRRPLLFSFIYILAALAAIVISIATIFLGYKHRISLDAIAAVVFALIPGLVSFPRDAFMEVFVFTTIIYLRVFPVRYKDFSYVTIGRPCYEDMHANENSSSGCSHDSCEANIYIRKLIMSEKCFPRLSKKIYRSKNTDCVTAGNPWKVTSMIKQWFSPCSENNAIRWNGAILQHTPTVVMVRNLVPVPEQKWYLALSRSVWLVMQPWMLRLSRPGQVVCALRLVSDIMAIGRLVIHFRGDIISQLIDELDFDADNKARAALQVCNSIIREIGLIEWGQLEVSQIKRLQSKSIRVEQLGDLYSLILLVLIFKSNLFGDWFHHERGQEELGSSEIFESNSPKCNLHYMEEGVSASSIMKRESCDSENDIVSSTTSNESEGNAGETGPRSGRKQNMINRSEFISKILRWLGWLVYGTMPFHDPLQVARFRHGVTSFKMIKKIKHSAANRNCKPGIDELIRKLVDGWLASWKCTVP